MTEEKLTFHNHPLKADIVARWENNETNKDICSWLEAEHPELRLSISTLCKHHNHYKRNKLSLPSEKKRASVIKKDKTTTKIEKILWETVVQCEERKKNTHLLPKDYQYYDQQQQHAIEKIMRIQERQGDSKDLSLILSELFQRMELGQDVDVNDIVNKELSEEEKLEIVSEVGKENEAQQS